MFRTDFGISDKDFDKVSKPFVKDLDLFFYEYRNLLTEFVAYYIAKGLEHNTLWVGNLDGFINGATDTLSEYVIDSNVDKKLLKQILMDNYSLKVIGETPLQVKIIKKEPSD